MSEPLILNLGCGKNPIEGMVNVDWQAGEGVDLVTDLDFPGWPWADDEVDGIFASHVIEHIANPLVFMQEAWRVVRPSGTITLVCPYGSSDDAWENPDHKRPYFLRSWSFFGQPNYWREGSYGFTADWEVEEVELRLSEEQYARVKWSDEAAGVVDWLGGFRNVITEQSATLRCVKPVRAQERALQEPTRVRFSVLMPTGDGRTNRIVSVEEYERDREEWTGGR